MITASLGLDPARYFLDAAGRAHPLAVEHATGEPAFAVVDGKLVPYAAYRAAAPAPAAEPLSIQAAPGTFAFGVSVTN